MPALAARRTAAYAARAHVRSTLATWELSDLADVAETIISELVANAINASADTQGQPLYLDGKILKVWIRLDAYGSTLRAEVWDQAPGVPELQEADENAESGRGLALVRDFADAWGWYPARGQPGKCVWAEISAAALTGPGHLRKVPQLLTITTSPSASMRRSAATTVLRATPYSAASSATEGSRSSDCHSPLLIRPRSADSTRRLGSSGVRLAGISP